MIIGSLRSRTGMTNTWHFPATKQGFCCRPAVLAKGARRIWARVVPAARMGGLVGVFLCAGSLASARPAGTQAVPLAIQDVVEAAVSYNLPLPETAKWNFDFMVDSGSRKLVCGRVDFQSSARVYVGETRFYAYVKNGKVTLFQLQDSSFVDRTGAEAEDFHALCDRN